MFQSPLAPAGFAMSTNLGSLRLAYVRICTAEALRTAGDVSCRNTNPKAHAARNPEILHSNSQKCRGGHPDCGPGCLQPRWLMERGGASPLLNAFRLRRSVLGSTRETP